MSTFTQDVQTSLLFDGQHTLRAWNETGKLLVSTRSFYCTRLFQSLHISIVFLFFVYFSLFHFSKSCLISYDKIPTRVSSPR